MTPPAQSLTAILFDDAHLEAVDPFALFADWLEAAAATEPNDPSAMAIASVDEDGLPDLRMVLLRGHDARGFVFFTNFESAKARQLLAHPKAALLFHWKTQRRQVRVRGAVEEVSGTEADDYFSSRPRGSQVGAHASDQSRPLASRQELIDRVEAVAKRFEGGEVPRPAHWSGFRIVPQEIEFWKDGEFRLHDRVVFRRTGADDWSRTRLYP
jgi:pyridoxamine 5'-phosphate oxidase